MSQALMHHVVDVGFVTLIAKVLWNFKHEIELDHSMDESRTTNSIIIIIFLIDELYYQAGVVLLGMCNLFNEQA